MLHNHIPELIDILKKYENNIWDFLKKIPGRVEGVPPIKYVGDRPTTNYIDELKDYTKGLKAILSVADYGIITMQRAWFGTLKVYATTRVGITLMTADPTLREELGSCLLNFLLKNQGLIQGKATDWVLDRVQSGGFTAAPDGLFARVYYLWLKEVS